MAGRFEILTDEHWSKAHEVIMAIQRQRVSPGRFVRFLERLAAEDDPFAGVIRFVAPAD